MVKDPMGKTSKVHGLLPIINEIYLGCTCKMYSDHMSFSCEIHELNQFYMPFTWAKWLNITLKSRKIEI